MLDFNLKETSMMMRRQSNRHTQFPLFIIQEKQEVVKADGCGNLRKYVSWDGERELSVEQYEAIEACQEYPTVEDMEENGHDWVEYQELLGEVGHDLDSASQENLSDYREIEYDEEWVNRYDAGVFFTEQACDVHIRLNSHHYIEPRSYVISAWRNPEMVAAMQMILKLTGDDIPSHYA